MEFFNYFIISFPEFSLSHIRFNIFFGNFSNCHFEIFLGDMNSSFSKCKHTSFCTNSLRFSTTCSSNFFSNFFKVNTSLQVHFFRVDFKNIKTSINSWIWEFNFSINSTWSEKSRIKNINSVCGHNNFDIIWLFESIQLREEFEHGSLNFTISSSGIGSFTSYGIDLIHENNTGSMLSGHGENFSDHSSTFSDIFLC